MKLGSLDTDVRQVVVAEVGNNHEGSFEVASRLVDEAAKCGADIVKFQTFRTEHFQSRGDEARFQRLRGFELTPDEFSRLAHQARSRGIGFMSTPLDVGSVGVLEPLVDVFKIASGDNDFFALLERVAQTGKPVIVSTGMSDDRTIEAAVGCLKSAWSKRGLTVDLALLHCVSSYPAPSGQVNLRAITHLADRFPGVTIGYSDHTTGPEACVLAVALGARIIEKHFTLDKNFSAFRDHQLSADPAEMSSLVRRVREASEMLGQPVKQVWPCEEAVKAAARRSIHVVRDLAAGAVLTREDLGWLRPSGGLPPGREELVLGRPLRRALGAGQRLTLDDVE